ncbi:STE3-domain-containing protein [Peniophora sp. CONT]|nr:STE3-domain-containing protein [Peniophora sp. CONT]
MTAVDPTYPLYPIVCILTAAMLLMVLFTNFIRQSWNTGVAFLCFWLFLENLTSGINAIIWSDNADIKLYVYCDIVTHLQLITFVVKPMTTLIIMRRLYLIASLQSVKFPNEAARLKNLSIEWTLGLAIPVLVAGPFYYIIQYSRFQVDEGFGCTNSQGVSVLNMLLMQSWGVIPPLLSVTFYYPRTARILCRHRRDIKRFLQSNDSMSRTRYTRILVLASVDVLITLPFGIVNIVLLVTRQLSLDPPSLPLYHGWTFLHTDWDPGYSLYSDTLKIGTADVAQLYFTLWTSPVLAIAIFCLFGITSEARATYWRIICTIGGWFGWKPSPHARGARSQVGDIEFGVRPQDASLDLEIGSKQSFVYTGAQFKERGAGERGETVGPSGDEGATPKNMGIMDRVSCDTAYAHSPIFMRGSSSP